MQLSLDVRLSIDHLCDALDRAYDLGSVFQRHITNHTFLLVTCSLLTWQRELKFRRDDRSGNLDPINCPRENGSREFLSIAAMNAGVWQGAFLHARREYRLPASRRAGVSFPKF